MCQSIYPRFLFRISVLVFIVFSLREAPHAQQGIGINTTNPHPSALVDVVSTGKGLLIPRMTRAQRDMIPSPASGLLIYQWNMDPGFYAFDGSTWIRIGRIGNALADADGDTKIQVEENPDEDLIRFDVEGSERVVLARPAAFTLLSLPNNNGQVGVGQGAGQNITTVSSNNTAVGHLALYQLNEGHRNTAFGAESFYTAFTSDNSGFGAYAGRLNTMGDANTAAGISALRQNLTGDSLTAVGFEALYNNIASGNVAAGYWALRGNIAGARNVAVGHLALQVQAGASDNTVIGSGANPAGDLNTAIGAEAGDGQADQGTAVGRQALGGSGNMGSQSTALGARALAQGAGAPAAAAGYEALKLSASMNTAAGAGTFGVGGSNNAMAGAGAMPEGGNNSAVAGYQAAPHNASSSVLLGRETFSDTTLYNSLALGYNAGFPVASYVLNSAAIGARATAAGSDVISLGSIAGVNGASSSVRVGIGTAAPHASAILHLEADSLGFMPPRLNAGQVNAFPVPAEGMMVYRTDSFDLLYHDGTLWRQWHEDLSGTYGALAGETLRFDGSGWSPGYAAGLSDPLQDTYVTLEETPDADAMHLYLGFPYSPPDSMSLEKLVIRENVHGQMMIEFPGADGQVAMGIHNPIGDTPGNTAVGIYANYSLYGGYNTSAGRQALDHHSFTDGNTAIGLLAMSESDYASNCIAIGRSAYGVKDQSFPDDVIAIGHNALTWWGVGNPGGTADFTTAIGDGTRTCDTCRYSTILGYDAEALGNDVVVLGSVTDLPGNDKRISTGIGTTQPEGGLHVRHASTPALPHVLIEEETNNEGRIRFRTGASTSSWMLLGRPRASAANAHFEIVTGGLGLHLEGDGDAVIDGTLSQNSDARLKRDVVPRERVLDDLVGVSGYRYHWLPEGRSDALQSGVLAQELQSDFPELVHRERNAFLSVNYPAMAAVLLAALKELHARDQVQQAQLDAHAARIAALRERLRQLQPSADDVSEASRRHTGWISSEKQQWP